MATLNAVPVFTNGLSGHTGTTLNGGQRILRDIDRLDDGRIVFADSVVFYRLTEDGRPDKSLDDDGMITQRFGPNGEIAWGLVEKVVPLDGGAVLLAGTFKETTENSLQTSLFVARLNADGSVDPTFNKGAGKVVINPGPDTYDHVVGTAILEDGRFLLAASSSAIVGSSSGIADPQHIVLARFLPDGSPDLAFGKNGVVTGVSPHIQPSSMVVQADGKILAVATDTNSGGPYDFKVLRFNSDGTPDTTFGINGEITTIFTALTYNASARGLNIAVQADGKIVAVGAAPTSSADNRLISGFAVVRYNADGSLDKTFSGDGKFSEFIAPDQGAWRPQGDRGTGTNHARDLHIGDDGSITVVGATTKYFSGGSDTQLAMIRLRADGTLDTTFGTNGYTTTAPFAPTNAGIEYAGMFVDPDDRMVVGATVYVAGLGYQALVVRYNSDGTLDNTFGTSAAGSQNSAVYLAGHPDQFLHSGILIYDANVNELKGETYVGSHVTLVRAGGANAQDNFVAGGTLRFENGRALLAGVDIGSVATGDGTLRIDFNKNATQLRVNQALQSIAYENTDPAQAARQITIDWTFSDLYSSGKFSTVLTIQAVEVPYWIDALLDRRSEGQTADQLRQSLESFVGPDKNLAVKYDASGSGVFSIAQKQLVERVLSEVESAVGINFGATGIPLSIKNSTELDAGEGAATPLTRSGAGAYFALLEDSAAAGNTAIVLHALAHALGLKDGDKPSANGSMLPFEELALDFGDLDIAALQFLYGPNKSARAGNDIYRLDADGSNFIWDGAGSDTVFAEGITADLTLHLEPGHWDYIGSQDGIITAPGQITVNYGSVIENAIGGSGNDRISGTGAANALLGGAGNDRLEGLGGNDHLDGGAGIDIAAFSGLRSAYTVKAEGAGFTVTDKAGSGGTDILLNAERIQFRDGFVAIDLDGSAGQLYRLYKAVFGREPDSAGLGYWIATMDKGMTSDSVAKLFMGSAEFATQYGAQPDSTKLITTLYQNVLHREPDAGGFAWWRGMLDEGKISASDALLGFSESPENRAQVIGEIQNGIAFTPFYG